MSSPPQPLTVVMPPVSPQRRRYSWFAVAGLVLAVLVAPIGLVVSLVAIDRTGPGGHRGRGLAVLGTVVGALFTAGWLLGALAQAGAVAPGGQDDQVAAGAATTASGPAASPAPSPVVSPPPPPVVASAVPSRAAGPTVPGPGTPVVDGEFTFTVSRVERLGPTLGSGYLTQQAQGEFVAIYLSVTNTGDEARTLAAGEQDLYDSLGNLHQATAAYLAFPESNDGLWQGINPGNGVSDVPILYDVPPGTVLDRIVLHDTFYSAGASVSLR